jgi:Flp pilus assembly pilin Flp
MQTAIERYPILAKVVCVLLLLLVSGVGGWLYAIWEARRHKKKGAP